MKKFLSLALALVMCLSLVTISAGAKDFTDDSKITYGEAVDVISAVGIVDGYEDGSFNPSATLTRGAAAKIITNMILGPTTAGALTADAAPFKDVPANHTFAGQIAYCASQGIINGYADKSFRPAGTVTGYQFMKMLLGALGYDGKIEGYTGDNWTVNVAKRAGNVGLIDGNDSFVGTAAMTREEACLYAFNALQATMVEYENKGSSIIIGGVEYSQGASAAKDMVNNTTSANTIKKDGKMQFAENYFKDLKLNANDTDAFNRPANTWTNKSNKIGTYAKEADATYTEEVKLGTIYSDLGLGKSISASDVTFSVNGNENEAGKANDNSTELNTLGLSKGLATKVGGNGVLTEVYFDDDDNTAVITLVNTYAGEVKGVHAATSSRDAYINVSPAVSGVGTAGTFDTEESFSVDDVVLFTYSTKVGDTGVQSVVPAEQVSGNLEAYTAGKSVTVGGTAYKANAAYAAKVTGLDSSVGFEVELTLDAYGYVLNVDTDKTSGNYAVVLDAGKSGFDNMARLLFTDGTTKDVVLKDSTIGAFNDADTGLTIGDIVSYKVNSDNKYTLTLLADGYNSPASGKVVTKGSAGTLPAADYANIFKATPATNRDKITSFTGKTIFLIKDKSGNYTSYTGIANVPTVEVTATGVPMAIYAKTVSGTPGTGVATVVYIDASANTTVSSSSKDVVFVKGSSVGSSYDSVKGTYYTYDAIVNGEITTINTVTQTTVDTLYTSVSYDKNNVATLDDGVRDAITIPSAGAAVPSVGTATTGAKWDKTHGTEAESNGAIGVLGSYYTYADDCTVFYKDTDGNLSASSISSISDDDNDIVFVKFVDGEITCIVIVQVAEGGSGSGNVDTSIKSVVLGTDGVVTLTLNGAASGDYSVELYKLIEGSGTWMLVDGSKKITLSSAATGTVDLSGSMTAGSSYKAVINGVESIPVVKGA